MPTAQIPIPRLSMGKRKQRSVMTEVFMDDGQIKEIEDMVLRGCAVDGETSAYVIDDLNQFEEKGIWYQILGERSCIPICLRNKTRIPDITNLVNEIFKASYEMEKRQQFINALKNTLLDKLLWFISIPCSTILLIYVINRMGK
jgi:hypothetical protein